MCLAIFKPRGKILNRGDLERGFEVNDDGAGFAYSWRGKLFVEKGYFDFNSFWRAFSKVPKSAPAMVHFRRVSLGIRSVANCHPFLINDTVAAIHNGTLHEWKGRENSRKSDTLIFVQQILKPLLKKVPEAYLDPVFCFLLEKTIDTGNKMVLLDSRGRHSILREWAGEWDGGCWFSNDSYKTPKSFSEETDPDYLSEEEWRRQYNERAISHTTKEKKRTFKPKSETEKILGGRSLLGEIEQTAQQKKQQQEQSNFNYLKEMQGGQSSKSPKLSMRDLLTLVEHDPNELRRLLG